MQCARQYILKVLEWRFWHDKVRKLKTERLTQSTQNGILVTLTKSGRICRLCTRSNFGQVSRMSRQNPILLQCFRNVESLTKYKPKQNPRCPYERIKQGSSEVHASGIIDLHGLIFFHSWVFFFGWGDLKTNHRLSRQRWRDIYWTSDPDGRVIARSDPSCGPEPVL